MLMCAGNSSGIIHIFHIAEEWAEVVQVDRKQVHEKAITDIATSACGRLVATADDAGALCLWRMERQLEPVNTFPAFG
jgi:hypothetical protein